MSRGTSGVITDDAARAFDALFARLERQAAALAEARVRDGQLERGDPAQRWRRPELLWPVFVKGS